MMDIIPLMEAKVEMEANVEIQNTPPHLSNQVNVLKTIVTSVILYNVLYYVVCK